MFKKEIELKKNVTINQTYHQFENYQVNHDLITKLNEVSINATLVYHDSIKTLEVKGEIGVNFDAIDARDGKQLKDNSETIAWNEQYLFDTDENEPDYNIVFGEEFDELQYAIDEIVLNIPINFTRNYGKITFVNEFGEYFDEEEFAKSQENKMDPRWEKLNELKFKK